MKERGLCTDVDRPSGVCKVLFDNVKRPVTIEMDKVIPNSELRVPADFTNTGDLLRVLHVFTSTLAPRPPQPTPPTADASEQASGGDAAGDGGAFGAWPCCPPRS